MSIALGLFLLQTAAWAAPDVASGSGADAEPKNPWYARSSCIHIEEMILAVDFAQADKKIESLEKSSDVEDRACAAWMRVALSEAQISFAGRIPATLKNREDALLKMYRFGLSQKKGPAYIADLAMEARMRRIRGLVEKGERTLALTEARKVKEMLAARKGGPVTPSVEYASGLSDLAVSQSGWALRTILSMAGVSGDAEKGRKELRALMAKDTVYRYDTHYVLYHFARENPSEEAGDPKSFSSVLAKKFPSNPQFIYDYAKDLSKEQRCKDSLDVMSQLRTQMEGAPNGFSSTVRAKLFYLTGRCALEVGDRPTAKKYAELASSQGFEELKDDIDDLKEKLAE